VSAWSYDYGCFLLLEILGFLYYIYAQVIEQEFFAYYPEGEKEESKMLLSLLTDLAQRIDENFRDFDVVGAEEID